MITPTVFREVLNDSISSGRFADTKIILYSRRDASGTTYKLKALYANSRVPKSVPYFSDRVYARTRYVQGNTVAGGPPPCSPKAIYSLAAAALEIPELCDLSSTRIMSQVTAANVTIELFSHFSSQQSNITQMQSMEFTHRYKYYGASDFQGAKIIGSMANGSSPHRVGALKLALREGILGGVFLRWPQRDCLLYTNCGIPRDELGGGPATSHCSRHLVELECSSCRTPIVSKDNRCRVCKRRFTGHPH